MSLLDVQNVTKTFASEGVETRALRGITFSVDKGEFIAIMGPSGSGKSTLLHILGLLDRPTDGSFIFDGRDTSKFDDDALAHFRNAQIGFVFQAFHLLARSTVLENVMLPLYYSDVPLREYESRARKAIDQVGLSERAQHEPSQLSGGERQRVAIARALVNGPSVIFADEPTGNLDSKTGKLVMDLIDNLHEEGHTVIVITHETPTANYAQRVIHLKDGLIEEDHRDGMHHREEYHK